MIPLICRLTPIVSPLCSYDKVYDDVDIRQKATVVESLANGQGLLAVCDRDPIYTNFVVFRIAIGNEPTLWDRLFDGNGPSGILRELRHTNWGDSDGYIFYPNGQIISEAFQKLKRWFDCE